MVGALLNVPAAWKLVTTTVVLGLTLGSCEIPLFQDAQPAPSQAAGEETAATDGSGGGATAGGGTGGEEATGDDTEASAERPAAAAANAQVAVYMGWRATDEVDAFSSWLGRPVWAHDFLDHRQGWSAISNPRAQLDAWSRWVAQDDDRRLVLSVPLLTNGSAGDFAGGAAGAYDRHFTALAQNLVAAGLEDTVIRLGWEFNGNTFPWAVGAGEVDQYRRFWRRVVKAMRSVDGAAFAFDWCPNITLDATGLPFAELYPGDGTVDIIGLGFYDYYWNHPGASPEARWQWLRDVDNGLRDHRTFAAAHDKPISFPEYGLWEQGSSVGGGGDDPYFIRRLATWISGSELAYHGYNNVDATADHRLTSYPQARRAYLDAFGG